ncbi:MAG: HAD-IIIA family hydrolase [Oligoflexales bacterium]|nr:HAD-IIIA family hydrolase [Oligoflexales bacterium]
MNVDKGVYAYLEDDEIIQEAPSIISYLINKGYLIFVVTNQPVVARGLISEKDLENRLNLFQVKFGKIDPHAKILKIYYCPHHPNANDKDYRVSCECRKPKPGMLQRAAAEFELDLNESFMVGDRMSDIVAGALAGCKTIQFLSGKHDDKPIESDLLLTREIHPDYKIRNLLEIKGIV